MRTGCGILCTACAALAVAGTLRADDQAVVQEIVQKAIRASGGESKLTGVRASTWKSKNTLYKPDGTVITHGKFALEGTDRYRADVTTETQDGTTRRITVVNGRRCWVREHGKTKLMSRQYFRQVQAGTFNVMLANNPANLTGPDVKLSLVGEFKVGDRPAVALTAVGKEGHELTLYFDKQRGVVLKTAVNDSTGVRPVLVETVYTDFREVEGVLLPFKASMYRGGTLTAEMELLEIKVSKKRLDPTLFARP